MAEIISVCSNVEAGSLETDNLEDIASKDVMKDTYHIGSNKENPKTIQHLLSDWRPALPIQPKIKQPGGEEDAKKEIAKIKQPPAANNKKTDRMTGHRKPKVKIVYLISYLKIIYISNFSGHCLFQSRS